MKSAIVTGGFGRLGRELVAHLTRQGVATLCVGRLPPNHTNRYEVIDNDTLITRVRLAPSAFRSYADVASHIPWHPVGESVLFHLAWGKSGQLASPDVRQQIDSAGLIAGAVNLATAYRCTRFVNAGSQQERFVEDFHGEQWRTTSYATSQGIYGAAKLIARDLGSVLCYLKNIDFMNVRFSTYVSPDLHGQGYIASVLRAIMEGQQYQQPSSLQWCEILPIEEVARAFTMIGERGVNKADYYIGTDRPRTLGEYFNYFSHAVRGSTSASSAWTSGPLCERDQRHFDPVPLREDVGFNLAETFETFSRGIALR